MPSGAKKRKALKKKKQQQQESITNNQGFNGDNLHGIDEHGSQDDSRESDGSLSSPASQGNEEFGTKDPSGMVKGAAKEEISGDADVKQGLGPKSGNGIAVERGTGDQKKNNVEKSTSSSSENSTHTAKNVACRNACCDSVSEIAPVVDSVKPVVSLSKVAVSEKSEHVETSTHSNLVKEKSEVNKEKPSPPLEKDNSKVVTLPRPASAEPSKVVVSDRESEVPLASEDKRLLLPGPLPVRTSWLSCCGLFDAMTGSDR